MSNTNARGVQYLSDGGDDGVSVSQAAADKMSFYGNTPVVQPTAAVAISTSAPTTSAFGFTSAQAVALITAVNKLISNNALTGLDG